ncbi:M12 family metallopeptidase [Sphingobacterium spiritivorum]|uniref:M12 family metallopeptidase n=1 Tax=Sphingobacterium spiritivorum TaxID=258 RepID=UPI003DA50CD0
MKKLKILKALLLLLTVTITFNSCRRDIDAAPDDQTQEDTTSFQKLMINGNEVLIKQENGKYYISDDEVLSERQLNILKDLARKNTGTVKRSAILSDVVKKWPNGVWYYKIVSSRRTEILQAMSWIASNSNITFVERTNQANYVTIYDTSTGTSGSNHVGMESGTKEIYLAVSQGVGTIAHEILHSLGFFHEQSRPDRDQHINVYLDRISDNDTRRQYQINPLATGIGIFDFNSIMIYSSNGIMEKKNVQGWNGWIAQRDSLSKGDIEGLAYLYGPKITNGPLFICNEGIYTVNAGTVTLENATNIATLSALGNNRYKVTRIGNSAGSVTLKAVFQGKTYTKDILVGIPSSLNILSNAGGNMQGGATYGFHLEENYPLTSISWNITGGIILSGQGTNNISVKVDPNPFQTYNNLGISLQYTSDCGNGSGNKTFYIAPSGGTSPIDPGEPL